MDLEHYPHPSRRSALLAGNGVVATSQPLAAAAGLQVLREGGNAVDAAIATAAALTVLEPTSNGIGGDAFALVWDGERLHGLNGSGRAPRRLSAAALRDQGHTAVPERGWAAVTVPGAPDAWGLLQERFARLPLEALLGPAIAYAEQGFPVSPVIAGLWREARALFAAATDPALAAWAPTFAPQGRAPRAGERWASPAHAATLRRLAGRGVRDLYEGELAERIAAHAAATGGLLEGEDLAAYHGEWVEPIGQRYRDVEVWEIPPNGQGIAALEALGLLDGLELAAHPPGSAALCHLQIEAMKLAFADAYRFVADPACVPVPSAGLLDAGYLAARRARIGERAALPEAGLPPGGGTVYLCTADRDGWMVSLIQSNYMGFGSGIVVPGTGIALHNRGAGFVLEAGHPNEAAGGKRPRHTILPAFLTRDGAPLGPFGVMGGEMQPQGHLQVVSAMIDHGLNPQAALDAPRWRLTGGLGVELEEGLAASAAAGLEERGHAIARADGFRGFGRGQAIWRLAEGVYAGASDPRADGAALGW